MPDIGGFGRGLLKGALSATEKAADKVKDAAEAASRRMNDDDDPDATQIVKTSDPDATQVVDTDDPEITQVIPGSPKPVAPRHRAQVPAGAALGAPAAFSGDLSAPPAPAVPPAPVAAPAPPATPPAPAAVTESEPTLDDEPEDHAEPSEVEELVEMFQKLIAKRRPPAGPIPGDWAFGVGDLLAEHPRVPKRVRGLVLKLNRFGGVAYSPQEVAFDGDDVEWEKATELRTRHIVDYLVGDAVQQQVENLPMPWFPGRKRVLDALGQALLTITIATAKDQLEKFELDLRIPAEVAYKASFGRTKEINAGVVSALVLADPAVNQSLVATARARGITVTADEDELLANAEERAEKIREKVKALEAELERFTKRFGRSG
jgi:hypothetical protein